MTAVPVRSVSPQPAATWLVDQLPVCFAGDEFLRRFVGIFQEVGDGLRQGIDSIEHAVDVTVAPPAFVRWLGGWLGMTSIDRSLPVERQRALVREFGRLLARRGTATALREALESVTGQPAVVRDPGGIVRHGDPLPAGGPVRIDLPAPGLVTEEDVMAVVADWIPAPAAAAVWIDGRALSGRGAGRP